MRVCVCARAWVTRSCPILCDSMDCSPPGFSLCGILQAGTLEWVAILFPRGSSWPRDQTRVSCIAGRLFTILATREFCLYVCVHISLFLLMRSILIVIFSFWCQTLKIPVIWWFYCIVILVSLMICLRCSFAYTCTVEQYYEDVLLEMYRDEEGDGRGFDSP